MLEEIKRINETKKYTASVRFKLKVIRPDYFGLMDNLGNLVYNITNIDNLYEILKTQDWYITNLSILNTLDKSRILSYTAWNKVVRAFNVNIQYNSFSIVRADENYISKLFLLKKPLVLLDSEAYKLLVINNVDLMLVSRYKLKILDETQLYFCGKIKHINIENLDVSEVTGLRGLFCDMNVTETIHFKNFNTKRVRFFCEMFKDCTSLKEVNISEISTDSATSFESMFDSCTSLERLDLNHFRVNKVDDFNYMFSNCKNLREVRLDKWATGIKRGVNGGKMIYDIRGIFQFCNKLENLDTSVFYPILSLPSSANVLKANAFLGCPAKMLGPRKCKK